MYEASFTVLSCTGKGTSKGTVYEIAGSDGVKYQTWDANIAAKASGLQGQLVAARVEQKQNGKWLNYVLEDIGLPGTLVPTAAPIAAAPVAAPVANIPMQAPAMPDAEKQKLIVRQSVLKTAFEFVGTVYTGAGPESLSQATEEAFELAGQLFKKVYVADATPTPVPTTPAEVAAVVPGVQVGTEGVETATAPSPEW